MGGLGGLKWGWWLRDGGEGVEWRLEWGGVGCGIAVSGGWLAWGWGGGPFD